MACWTWQQHRELRRDEAERSTNSLTASSLPSFRSSFLLLFFSSFRGPFDLLVLLSHPPSGRTPLKTRSLPSLFRSVSDPFLFLSLSSSLVHSSTTRIRSGLRAGLPLLPLLLSRRDRSLLARSLVVNLRNEACRKAAY